MVKRNGKKDFSISGILGIPPFYLMFVILVFLGLAFIMLTGLPSNNPGLIIFSLIFGFLAVTSTLLFSNTLAKTNESFTTSSQGFVLGFLAWFSFLSIKNRLLVLYKNQFHHFLIFLLELFGVL